jgi:hypothetical protein
VVAILTTNVSGKEIGDYVMVEAKGHLKLLSTSILDIGYIQNV